MTLAVGGRLSRVVRGTLGIGDHWPFYGSSFRSRCGGVVQGTAASAWFTDARSLIGLVVVVWHVREEAKLRLGRMRCIALMVAWAAPALVLLAVSQRVA